MFKCPYRKEIVTITDDAGTKTVATDFGACYEWQCPFWSGLQRKCMRPYIEKQKGVRV